MDKENDKIIRLDELRENVAKQEQKRLELYGESSNRKYLARLEVIEEVMGKVENALWDNLP